MGPVPIPVAQDIFRLPLLQDLTVHLPRLPNQFPGISASLTDISVTLDSERALAQVFTACRDLRVTRLGITYEGLSTPGNWESLASTIATGQLTQTLTDFFWIDIPQHEIGPIMLKAFLPFASLQSLQIGTSCRETPLCRFTFGHVDVCQLSSALPNLRIFHLGGRPCAVMATSVSFETLAIISKRCKYLESLRIHFNPTYIGTLSRDEELLAFFADGDMSARSEYALETLIVGNIQVVGEKELLSWYMALALSEIFPLLSVIEHAPNNEIWTEVEIRLKRCKAIKGFAGHM